jgi:hypothetical protein
LNNLIIFSTLPERQVGEELNPALDVWVIVSLLLVKLMDMNRKVE